MIDPISHLDGPCPVCGKHATASVGEFALGHPYDGEMSVLYHCIACGSAHFRHDPADSSSVGWHKKVMERNLQWAEHLETALASRHQFRSVIDIGCGIGTWLHYLSRRNYRVLGFEPGSQAAAFGRRNLQLDIQPRIFSSDKAKSLGDPFDLVTCIMVLEHLRQPRAVISEIAKYCIETGALAFVSVPFYYGFTHLKARPVASVFNSTAAHVTYFSEVGLKRAFLEFGLECCSPRKIVPESNNWSGFLFRRASRDEKRHRAAGEGAA